jgi:uncharacterized membrane protein YhaH (DUF805 family)
MTIATPPDPGPGHPSPSLLAGLGTLLFSFRGRMSRRNLWMRFLPAYLVVGVAALILAEAVAEAETDAGSVVMLAFFVFTLWSGSVVLVKRCHDRGRSLWFLGLALAPSLMVIAAGIVVFTTGLLDPLTLLQPDADIAEHAGYLITFGLAILVADILQLWVMIELYFLRGTIGDNRYGPDPAARA